MSFLHLGFQHSLTTSRLEFSSFRARSCRYDETNAPPQTNILAALKLPNIARKAIRPRGTLVMKSTYAGEMSVNFSSLVVDEIPVVGSGCGPFAPALRLLERREVDPTVLISAQYKLGEALKAFEHAAQPGVLKVLIEM